MNPLTLAQEIIDGRRITRVQTAFEKPVSETK
jgi:hypothetical protein